MTSDIPDALALSKSMADKARQPDLVVCGAWIKKLTHALNVQHGHPETGIPQGVHERRHVHIFTSCDWRSLREQLLLAYA
jgi:hypothetical protein